MSQPDDQHQSPPDEPSGSPDSVGSEGTEYPAFPVTVPPLSPDLAPPRREEAESAWSMPEPAAEPGDFSTYHPADPDPAPTADAPPSETPSTWVPPADASTEAWTTPAAPAAWGTPAEPTAAWDTAEPTATWETPAPTPDAPSETPSAWAPPADASTEAWTTPATEPAAGWDTAEPTAAWETPAEPPAAPTSWAPPAEAQTDAWTTPAEPTAPPAAAAWETPVEPTASPPPAPAWGTPAEPAAWGAQAEPPAAPAAWGTPAEPAAWGAQAEPPASEQPAYQPPQDPFATSAIPGGQPAEPANPYTAPTYYPTQAPAPAQPVYTPGSAPVPPPPTAPISAAPYPYPGYPGYPAPPKKKSKALVITAVVLGLVLTLCAVGGVGAYFLLRDTEGTGQATAQKAADDFLTAIYKDGDVDAAEKLVCGEARDKKALTAKINEVKDQKAKLKSPAYTWDTPKIADETDKAADTTVTVQLATSDEKVAQQTLKLMLVKHDGWFVCEVQEQK